MFARAQPAHDGIGRSERGPLAAVNARSHTQRTLLATPVIYSLFDDAQAWFQRLRAR